MKSECFAGSRMKAWGCSFPEPHGTWLGFQSRAHTVALSMPVGLWLWVWAAHRQHLSSAGCDGSLSAPPVLGAGGQRPQPLPGFRGPSAVLRLALIRCHRYSLASSLSSYSKMQLSKLLLASSVMGLGPHKSNTMPLVTQSPQHRRKWTDMEGDAAAAQLRT